MPKRRSVNLFEAMSKAPQVQMPRPSPKLSFWKRNVEDAGPALMVAEPLTEEQAAAELAAERAQRAHAEQQRIAEEAARESEREARRQARQAEREVKLRAKLAERELRLQAKLAARQARAQTTAQEDVFFPLFRLTRGRLILSLNTTSGICAAALLVAILVSAFAIGRRSGPAVNDGNTMQTVAGVTPGASTSPLLPPLPSKKKLVQPPRSAEMEKLLSAPPSRQKDASEQPVQVVPNGGAQIGSGDGLNYLQIESFRFSANDTPDMVRAEVNQARAFLAERGVKTVLRRHPKGYVLYAEEGYPKGSQAESSRREFADRIEALGKEYRKDGGRYEFKGCYFVSADHLTRGQPE